MLSVELVPRVAHHFLEKWIGSIHRAPGGKDDNTHRREFENGSERRLALAQGFLATVIFGHIAIHRHHATAGKRVPIAGNMSAVQKMANEVLPFSQRRPLSCQAFAHDILGVAIALQTHLDAFPDQAFIGSPDDTERIR